MRVPYGSSAAQDLGLQTPTVTVTESLGQQGLPQRAIGQGYNRLSIISKSIERTTNNTLGNAEYA